MSKDLKKFYDSVYEKDKNQHFLKYRDGRKLAESHLLTINWLKENKASLGVILDFGCGECDYLGELPRDGRRIGIDFSEPALAKAKESYPHVETILGREDVLSEYYESSDLVVSFGTLEHVDKPIDVFKKLSSCVKKDGHLIISCPSFLNVRGIIWMTLVKLFDVPMSLSDKHFLSIHDFNKFIKEVGDLELVTTFSSDLEIAQGEDFRLDMKKRLTNALKDASMDNSRVDDLICWVEDNMDYLSQGEYSGSEVTYIIRKK